MLKHPPRSRTAPARARRGITLLESLIAVVILAFGVLGMLSVQLRTLAETQSGVRRAQAVRLIEDLSERIKSNPGGFKQLPHYLSDWDAAPIAEKNCKAAACDPAQLASWDLAAWKQSVADTLPLGKACIFESPGETAPELKRQLGVIVGWRATERDGEKAGKPDPFALDTPTAEARCPAGLDCHLVHVQP